MKIVLCLFAALSCVCAFENSDDFINEINSKQSLWTAGRNFPETTSPSDIKSLLGLKELPKDVVEAIPVINHTITDTIPESFDARTHWAKCKVISQVADQSACGSCWAVAVTSAITDRICIHSDGKKTPQISAKNLMSCCRACGYGCEGGYPYIAWKYWVNNGLVTGGPYGSKIGCQPYPFESCEHHTTGPKPDCPKGLYPTPKCVRECDSPNIVYATDVIQGKSSYRVPSIESQIQQEILTNGPVSAQFTVYSDFVHYKSGVYSKTIGSPQGGHAVRIIGWGVEKGVKYWLVMNSWNEDWGEKGLFKIRRGTNECGFEAQIYAGLPK